MQLNNLEEIIKNRLYRNKASFKTDDRWKKITYNEDFGGLRKIKVKFPKIAEPITLDLPFTITNELAYFYGLCAYGSFRGCYLSELNIALDAGQLSFVKKLCTTFGVDVEYTELKRARKKVGADCPKSDLFKIFILKVPAGLYKYLKCLGLNPRIPSIPDIFTEEQEIAAISGCLNSRGTFFRTHRDFHRRSIWIRLPKSLRSNIPKILTSKLSDFEPKIVTKGGVRYFIIKKRYIPQFIRMFNVTKYQIFYRAKLVELSQKHPHLCKILKLNQLDGLSQSILAIIYYYFYMKNKQTLPFTLLEDILNTTNNEIRKGLYGLHRKGLVTFYKDEQNKDFVSPSVSGVFKMRRKLQEKLSQLQFLMLNNESVYFRCQYCKTAASYSKLINGKKFVCPNCGSETISEFRPREIKITYAH